MNGRDRCIVVVDDNPANLLAMEALLSPLGRPLLMANNAEEGLRQASRDDVALVISDVSMPEVDGFQMVERMRDSAAGRRIPVVFLTAHGYDPIQARRAHALGVIDYITKPVDPDTLRAKIEAMATTFDYLRGEGGGTGAGDPLPRRPVEAAGKQKGSTSIPRERFIPRTARGLRELAHDLTNDLFVLRSLLQALRGSPSLSDVHLAKIETLATVTDHMGDYLGELLDAATSADVRVQRGTDVRRSVE
jgi:CheY-like chemotaxis protein